MLRDTWQMVFKEQCQLSIGKSHYKGYAPNLPEELALYFAQEKVFSPAGTLRNPMLFFSNSVFNFSLISGYFVQFSLPPQGNLPGRHYVESSPYVLEFI